MGWEHEFKFSYDAWTNEADRINRQNEPKHKLIDCGELIEVDGIYVPAT
jgi:hypothetical protein